MLGRYKIFILFLFLLRNGYKPTLVLAFYYFKY